MLLVIWYSSSGNFFCLKKYKIVYVSSTIKLLKIQHWLNYSISLYFILKLCRSDYLKIFYSPIAMEIQFSLKPFVSYITDISVLHNINIRDLGSSKINIHYLSKVCKKKEWHNNFLFLKKLRRKYSFYRSSLITRQIFLNNNMKTNVTYERDGSLERFEVEGILIFFLL